jgi:predicted O-methyltransferase YrrM
LYLPVSQALPSIFARLASGGIIVIDDCAPGGIWDGALQAYGEFCSKTGATQEIHCQKLGVLRKS